MKKKILVVEDSPTQAQRAQLILQSCGYEVKWVQDGLEGLEETSSYNPDMVVTDVKMPNMNGYQMTRELKSRPETKKIPVLMLTTKNEVNDIIKGLEAGADNFITKPYESSFLIQRVENIFSNLALRQKGKLKEDRELENLKDKIVLTTDRKQILEILLSAISVVIHCNVIGIFLLSEVNKDSLLMVSLQQLSKTSSLDLRDKILAAAEALVDEEISTTGVRITSIVKNKEFPRLTGSFNSFISVPLISEGKVIGILTAANEASNSFNADDVKYLFMMGSESSAALNRISR
ncbi:MAG TPA: response regulator [Actinobacteria bacterium]|nr:response regulator [Actinomycetes bacterium]HEX21262.1 response regulator [Actinomycetota bacterium]